MNAPILEPNERGDDPAAREAEGAAQPAAIERGDDATSATAGPGSTDSASSSRAGAASTTDAPDSVASVSTTGVAQTESASMTDAPASVAAASTTGVATTESASVTDAPDSVAAASTTGVATTESASVTDASVAAASTTGVATTESASVTDASVVGEFATDPPASRTGIEAPSLARAEIIGADHDAASAVLSDIEIARHAEFMSAALIEAHAARAAGEVPIGCVLVHGDAIIARGHNLRERAQDPTAHAEIVALKAAAARLGTWRLSGVTAYVTLEPCPMCAGALVNARVDRVVYGAADPKAGATETLYRIGSDPRLNHRFTIVRGVRAAECGALLSEFFAGIRAAQKRSRSRRSSLR